MQKKLTFSKHLNLEIVVDTADDVDDDVKHLEADLHLLG